MNDPSTNGIHLTKEYYKDFLPTDLQWSISEIDDDFTLYDIFRLVSHAAYIIPNIFTTMGMLEFEAFWEQIQLDRSQDYVDDVDYLELYWGLEYDTRITKKTGKHTDQTESALPISQDHNYWDNPKIAEMRNLMGLQGIGKGCPEKMLDFHECGDDCPTTTAYAVEFTPINDLAHLPIRVSPKMKFFPPYVESDRDFHRTGFELTIEPTLWCLITSIFWELTFAGPNPQKIQDHRATIMDHLDEAMREIDDEHEDD